MTTKPKIELKNVDVNMGLSEETPCYTAKLYVNGEHFADVGNHGHGGPDMVHPPKGYKGTPDAFDAKYRELDQLVASTYEKHEYEDMTFDESVECLCHGLVWDHVDKRNFRSKLSRKIMFVAEDGTLRYIKGKKTPQLMEAFRKKYGGVVCLNDMDFDEAFELYIKHAG